MACAGAAGAQGRHRRGSGFSGAGRNRLLEAEVLERGEFGERLLSSSRSTISLPPRSHRPHAAAAVYSSRRCRSRTASATRRFTARERGSVAAPTAGLHFTPQMLDEIAARGVEIARVTLHVGLGTFAPLRVERVDDVRLHRERYTLSAETADAINRARREGRRIVAVGTTVVRTLESLRAARPAAGSFSRTFGRNRDLHLAGIRVPAGRRAAYQFSSAAIEPADAGERVCRPRACARRLSPRGRAALPVLQLRRLHVYSRDGPSTVHRPPFTVPAVKLSTVPDQAKPPVFLLDAMSFIFRAYHAMQRSRPMSTRSGLPTAATYVFVNMINKLRQDFRAGVFRGGLRRERRGVSRRARARHGTLRKWNAKDAEL